MWVALVYRTTTKPSVQFVVGESFQKHSSFAHEARSAWARLSRSNKRSCEGKHTHAVASEKVCVTHHVRDNGQAGRPFKQGQKETKHICRTIRGEAMIQFHSH